MTEEFREQPRLLQSLIKSRQWSEVTESAEPILVGAGDSYAASLCASFLAGPRVTALDPHSLNESIGWAKNRQVYIISISGRTVSNIELAKALNGVAAKIIAITSNPTGPLAATADAVVEIPFRPQSKSPGIASFALSLAIVLKVCGLNPERDYAKIMQYAVAEARRVRISSKPDVTYFVANNESYGVSIYGAAKIYELIGGRAQVSLLEEFSHMPLFSLSNSDCVNVIDRQGGKGDLLYRKLKDARYHASLIPLGSDKIENLYTLTFAMQYAAIRAAEGEGQNVPQFLKEKKKLRISDEMIY